MNALMTPQKATAGPGTPLIFRQQIVPLPNKHVSTLPRLQRVRADPFPAPLSECIGVAMISVLAGH